MPNLIDTLPKAVSADGAVNPDKVNLVGYSRAEIKAQLEHAGIEPAKLNMRSQQIWRWMYHYGAQSFADMTNISKVLRDDLAQHFTLERPDIQSALISKDRSRKWLIRFDSAAEAESVFIPSVSKVGALCVSSQVGCTLNCTFCHTGTQLMVRNLTASEIVAQIMVARDDLAEWPSSKPERDLANIVFMGMGEPLYNLDEVAKAIDILSDAEGIAISRRRITVSTAGVASKIEELGKRTRAMLAISLHAVNDDLRNEIVPINRKYDLKTLFEAIRAYPDLSNAKRVTFEYVMLKGVNDSLAEARDLVKLISGVPAKINLIPFNPWPDAPYECSEDAQIEAFADIVKRAGYAAPIRKPRGRDIMAACGQLRSESKKVRASQRFKSALQTEQG